MSLAIIIKKSLELDNINRGEIRTFQVVGNYTNKKSKTYEIILHDLTHMTLNKQI